MANCGANVLISKSIEELRTRKKRRDQDSVTIHAQKHHGLSIEDSHELFLNNIYTQIYPSASYNLK